MKDSEGAPPPCSVQAEIERVRLWRHRIPLPSGISTPGSQDTPASLERMGLPEDLTGRSVLDVGCSDGFYSFESEKRGAARVLAIDDFSSVYVDSPSGFHVARRLLGSNVELREVDLFELDPAEVGRFDLVLFLGVLYHLRHPLAALERMAALCDGQLIVETQIARRRSGPWSAMRAWLRSERPRDAFMEFYEGDVIHRDPTTWWAPSPSCMEAMLRSCGFCSVREVWSNETRGVFHAFHPRHGEDAQRLVKACGEELWARTCREILGPSLDPTDWKQCVETISIPDFAALQQRAAEIRAARWHQVEKHRIKRPAVDV